jgi:hypothetical protein
MKKIATRKLLAGAIGLLALFPGAAFAQSTLSVEAIETDNGAPPHNVVCDAETADVFSCLIWSPTGVIVERGRATTDGVSLIDIAPVSGAETNVAVAVVVGGAGSEQITQQRVRNSLAIALQGIGARALVATNIAGSGEVRFGPNGADMQSRLINQQPVVDPDAFAQTVFNAVDALAMIEGRPRALVLAGSAADAFSGREIRRLTRQLGAEGIVLTVLRLPSAGGETEAAIEDLPFANIIDTRPVDGALTGPQIGVFGTFVAPTVRMRLGDPSGIRGVGVDLAAEFTDGSRTEFRVSQGTGGVTSIGGGGFGAGLIGTLALLPRNIGTVDGMQGYVAWIVALIAGLLIGLYGLVQPRPRKEVIDVSSLRQMPMMIEDAELAGAALAGGAGPATEATEAATSANTAIPDETAMVGAGAAGGGKTIGRITFAGSARVERLRDGITRIGRLGPPDNDIVINETHVSRRHAEIFVGGDGKVRIRNLSLGDESQSRRENPVFVNGTQIQGDTLLSDGDEVRMAGAGDTRFTISLGPS